MTERVDLTTLAARVTLPPDHPLLTDPRYAIPSAPEPFSPDRTMYLLWEIELRLQLIESVYHELKARGFY